MKKVFIDTSGWIALLNVDDTWHQKARNLRLELLRQNYIFVTSNFILLEVGDALSSPLFRENTSNFIKYLSQLNFITIISLSDNLFLEGLNLYQSRNDKDWGLTDCISFVIMKKEGITEAFTTDKHFVQAGFSRLLT